MYRDTLVSGFLNISVYFNKLANNFKPLDRLFKRIKILLVIQTENQSATSSLSEPLLMRVLPHTVLRAEVILESYAEVYSNQFMTGNSPLQLVQ